MTTNNQTISDVKVNGGAKAFVGTSNYTTNNTYNGRYTIKN